jgi:hypothetical protein
VPAGEKTADYGIETSTIAQQEKIENRTIRRKTDVYRLLGLSRHSTGTL